VTPSGADVRSDRAADPAVEAPARPQPQSRAPTALVERARAGDREAFARLYEALFPGVSRYVGAMVRNPDRAEDVVAQAFLLAWQGLPKMRRPERFEPWLFRIAHNATISELRRRRTVPLEELGDPADPSRLSSPAALLDLQADHALVQQALRQLPPEQREVLVMRFLRELSHSEVARALGKSEQATRALQYRALRRLSSLLER
jgi:RNA polymerase sigma-70 factor (ECF subfamily)